MLRYLRYLLAHPLEAGRAFWQGLAGTEDPAERMAAEDARFKALRLAIGFYFHSFGRFPAKLEDLCFDNHKDPNWDSPFIKWNGSDTFNDTYGYPYQYAVADGKYTLFSPGLETAKKYYQAQPSDIQS